MKKTQKRMLGLFGLVAVIAMTFLAATLPAPETSALSTLTDTLNVRVVGESPNVIIVGPSDESSFVNPSQTIDYTYENVDRVTVTLKYTDKDNVSTETVLSSQAVSEEPGAGQLPLNLDSYGYGKFLVRVNGERTSGAHHEDVIEFEYFPVTAAAEQDTDDTDLVNVDLNYSENNTDIDTLVVNVYDMDGNLIESLSPTIVTPPTTTLDLDFGGNGLPSGTYRVSVTAYDANGNALYLPYHTLVKYTVGEVTPGPTPTPDKPIVPVPDTGGVFQGANISKTDYIITGLIVFALIAGIGIVYARKNRNNASVRTRRGNRRK